MLWVDCLSRNGQEDLRTHCERSFRLIQTSQLDQLDYLITRTTPSVICFDFDYPMESQLGAMQSVKRAHSSIPVVMLTVEHSEDLAVWAFRARVWNYLVKPVDIQEWRANLQVLSRIATLGPRQRRQLRLPGPSVETMGKASRKSSSYQALLPALEHIERRFAEHISAQEVAQLCGMSPFRFSREFHQVVGSTFQEHVLKYRIQEACRLMREHPNRPIADIGASVGFNDSSYFARIFKRYMNMKPSDYQRGLPGAPMPEPVSVLGSLDVPQRSASQALAARKVSKAS